MKNFVMTLLLLPALVLADWSAVYETRDDNGLTEQYWNIMQVGDTVIISVQDADYTTWDLLQTEHGQNWIDFEKQGSSRYVILSGHIVDLNADDPDDDLILGMQHCISKEIMIEGEAYRPDCIIESNQYRVLHLLF